MNKQETNRVLTDTFLGLGAICMLLLLMGCNIDQNKYTVGECTVERVDGGQMVLCGTDQLVIPDQGQVLDIIDPCGDGPGEDTVVLILEGDLYISWLKNVGMRVLEPYVQYQTIDQQRCKFQITPNGLEEI